MSKYMPPSPKMERYLLNLARERVFEPLGATAEARVKELERQLKTQELGKFDAMNLIDQLKAAPLDDTSDAGAGVKPGVYQRNGEVFVVKLNREGTRRYAKRLVEIRAQRLNEDGDRVRIEFEYSPGALQTLLPEDQMSLEDARPLLLRYGRCIACGRLLKAAASVERSVGPVCVKMFGPTLAEEAAAQEADQALTSNLAALLDQLREA